MHTAFSSSRFHNPPTQEHPGMLTKRLSNLSRSSNMNTSTFPYVLKCICTPLVQFVLYSISLCMKMLWCWFRKAPPVKKTKTKNALLMLFLCFWVTLLSVNFNWGRAHLQRGWAVPYRYLRAKPRLKTPDLELGLWVKKLSLGASKVIREPPDNGD